MLNPFDTKFFLSDELKEPSLLVTDIFHKLKENAIIPTYIHKDDSGMDVCALLEEPVIIGSYKLAVISTGLTVTLPPNTELQVRGRSGLASKYGVFVLNSPGTIDEGYKKTDTENAELKIILANFSDKEFIVNSGDRIAQLVFSNVAKLIMPNNYKFKERAGKGFGSSGV